jgi:RecA/RadA recombinase
MVEKEHYMQPFKLYQKLMKDGLVGDNYLDPEDTPPTDFISTGIIPVNLLFSAKFDGGIPVGKITTYAAHPQLGKSILGKILIRNAQKKGMYVIVFDTEWEWDWDQAKMIGINTSKECLHVEQMNQIEVVQTFIMNTVKGLSRAERNKIFIVIDSWGGLTPEGVTKKAEEGKQKQDNRDILLKNMLVKNMLGTQCTYYVTNHIYANIGGYGDPYKIGGGSKILYLSHCVMLGSSKAKEIIKKKDENEITGSVVTAKCQKSRCSKEFTSIEFRIKYDGGFDMFYGLLEYALEGGYVNVDVKTSRYCRPHIKDDKKLYQKDIYNSDFWIPIFRDTDFKTFVEKKFQFSGKFDIGDAEFMNSVDLKLKDDQDTKSDIKAEQSE